MDYWAQNCLAEVAEAARGGVPPPGHCSDAAMADTVMDFLFASQDASTASLVWTLTLMADHPHILEQVGPPLTIVCAAALGSGDPCAVGMCVNADPDGRTIPTSWSM